MPALLAAGVALPAPSPSAVTCAPVAFGGTHGAH